MKRYFILISCFNVFFTFSLFSQEKVKLKVASSRFRFGVEGNYLQNTTDAYTYIYTKDEDNRKGGYYGALNLEFFISKGSRNASLYAQLGYLNNRHVFYKGYGSSTEKYDVSINSIALPITLRYRLFSIDKKRSGWLFGDVGLMNLYTLNSERLLSPGTKEDFKSNTNSFVNVVYFGAGIEFNKLIGLKVTYMNSTVGSQIFNESFRTGSGSTPDEIVMKSLLVGLYINFIK